MLDALPYLLAEVDPSVLAKLGYSRKEMLRWCKYDGRSCADQEFSDVVDLDVGKCFSFNWEAKNYADRSGETHGINNARKKRNFSTKTIETSF